MKRRNKWQKKGRVERLIVYFERESGTGHPKKGGRPVFKIYMKVKQ